MKTCPVCALDLENTYLFCPDDGSSLALANKSPESEFACTLGSDDETAGAVVLYCPACAAEYPLTFATCPVHGVQLTKHRIPRSAVRALQIDSQPTIAGRRFDREQSRTEKPLTGLEFNGPEIESKTEVPGSGIAYDDKPGSARDVEITEFASPPCEADAESAGSVAALDYQGSLTDAHERGLERPGFRVVAITTGIALTLFCVMAISTLVSRSSSRAVRVDSNSQAAPMSLPFVPTPQEARDYKEQEQTLTPSEPPELQRVRSVDRLRNANPSPVQPDDGARRRVTARLAQDPTATTKPVVKPRDSNPPMSPLPRGNSGGFDARLIRVRSRKTSDGFRYDLTFNMQEQAGRSALWQRVLISTRSANGTSHSEAIPFSHRLGASGALTFTISVELTGRSESDWQGRILCTTLGWDNKGGPVQSSFGANVAP